MMKVFILFLMKDFDASSLVNDISLIKLGGLNIFSDYVIPACLPKYDDDVPIGLNCTITGWGDTEGTKKSCYFN